MHHLFRFPCAIQWASQSYLLVVFPRLAKSVLPTTLLRYHFLWVCPEDLRVMLSTKAARAAPREAVDRVSLVVDLSGEPTPVTASGSGILMMP